MGSILKPEIEAEIASAVDKFTKLLRVILEKK